MRYFPFIHKIKKKKERTEPLPLYIEQELPQPQKVIEKEPEAERGVIIIELF